MKTFLAIYRGGTVASAELVAVSADPGIVAEVTRRLLGENSAPQDPVTESLAHGRRSALEVIHREAVGGIRRAGRFSVIPSDAAATPPSGQASENAPDDVDDDAPGGDT